MYPVGTPGCHRVMAFVRGGVTCDRSLFTGVSWSLLVSVRTLKNVMLTLLFEDGHITCLAISALFPLMTIRDLQSNKKLWLYDIPTYVLEDYAMLMMDIY